MRLLPTCRSTTRHRRIWSRTAADDAVSVAAKPPRPCAAAAWGACPMAERLAMIQRFRAALVRELDRPGRHR